MSPPAPPPVRRLPLRVLVCSALLGTALASGQSGEAGPRVTITPRPRSAAPVIPSSDFRLQVNLIEVPVTVTDLLDRPVMGLPKTSFRIFEDDIEQQIAAFSMADGPVSAGIVFDSSGSMRDRIEQSRAAVEQFFQTSVAGDEFCLVRFSDRPDLLAEWTRRSGDISRELAGVRPDGWTAMIDGIRLSVEQMRHASNARRILLVLSDGGDNNSRYSQSELLSIVREADVQVWAVGLFERPRYLQRLAAETGGRVLWVHKLTELPDAIERLSREIRGEYIIGYFSNRAHNDGRYHKVRIEVQPPPGMERVRATWRRGYIAP